jgi:hypothetical protein
VTSDPAAAGEGTGGIPLSSEIGSRMTAAATSWPVARSSGATSPSRRRTNVPANA